jgi:hypothetical protein
LSIDSLVVKLLATYYIEKDGHVNSLEGLERGKAGAEDASAINADAE